MKPVIAMPQMGNDLFRKYMKSKYMQSLKHAGAEVCWIDLGNADAAVRKALYCDGLLLPGGADVNPKLYGQELSEKCGSPNQLRDAAEMKMLEAFLLTGKPIFGICRGSQLLNVFMGGTLMQDIKDIQKCRHMHFPSKNKGTHMVNVAANTRLSSILGQTGPVRVNSLHHQAVDRIGNKLTAGAVSEDGFIEEVEITEHPFCVGVQWHPEHMSRKNPLQQKLFDEFVYVCKGE